jgi:hypothetical protein
MSLYKPQTRGPVRAHPWPYEFHRRPTDQDFSLALQLGCISGSHFHILSHRTVLSPHYLNLGDLVPACCSCWWGLLRKSIKLSFSAAANMVPQSLLPNLVRQAAPAPLDHLLKVLHQSHQHCSPFQYLFKNNYFIAARSLYI